LSFPLQFNNQVNFSPAFLALTRLLCRPTRPIASNRTEAPGGACNPATGFRDTGRTAEAADELRQSGCHQQRGAPAAPVDGEASRR
jgi:hypothetical protein